MPKETIPKQIPQLEDPLYLRQKRRERNVTQQQLADESGLKQSTIAELENGNRAFSEHYRGRLWDALYTITRARRYRRLTPGAVKRIRAKAAKAFNEPTTPLEDLLSKELSQAYEQIGDLERQIGDFKAAARWETDSQIADLPIRRVN